MALWTCASQNGDPLCAQFYLFKNRAGYYVVRFIDPITGVMMSSGKSTHVKDKIEATMIATKWLENGTPDAYSGSRSFQSICGKESPFFQPF